MYFIPEPKNVTKENGSFTIRYNGSIIIDSFCPADIYDYALILQQEIRECSGFTLPILRSHETQPSGCIYLSALPDSPEQSYELAINERAVLIRGAGLSGILYGVQTLRQIIRQSGAVLPALSISDSPSLVNRGHYFDTSRGRVPTLEYLKKLADTLSFYKFNQLQLYIEHSYLFRNLSEMWRDDTPLTAEDILELDRYCRKLQIELVPSLASFGHLYKLLSTKTCHSLCELEGSDTTPFSFHDRMQHHTIDVTNPESLTLIKSLLLEYMQLFTSKHFNLCADETFDLGKGKSKSQADQKGVTAIYVEFVNEISKFVIENGRIPMFWSDVICEEPEAINQLPDELICLHWDYSPDVSEKQLQQLVDAGAEKTYVCPGVQGWNHLINLHHRAYENISRMCNYGHNYHSIGALVTDWGDFGHINHPEFSYPGLIYAAAFSWNDIILPEDEINRRISVVEYGDPSEKLVSVFRELGECEAFTWYYAVRVMESIANNQDSKLAAELLKEQDETLVSKYNARIDEQTASLYGFLGTSKASAKAVINAYIISGEGQKLLNLLLPVLKHAVAGTPESSSVLPSELASALENWLAAYRKLWKTTSRESEFYRIANVFFWYADYLRML